MLSMSEVLTLAVVAQWPRLPPRHADTSCAHAHVCYQEPAWRIKVKMWLRCSLYRLLTASSYCGNIGPLRWFQGPRAGPAPT
jgi:hypothetical protein